MKAPLKEWKIFERVPNAEAIAAGLKDIPAHWSLTPLQDKSPRRDNWQTEPFIPHSTIADLILRGDEGISKKTGKPYHRYWSGFGLRTGEASGGLLAIDVDGESAQPLLDAISGGDIPLTPSWSSGKRGRYQLLFQIPDEIRELLKKFNRDVVTEWGNLKTARDTDGKPTELLEFRYNGSQSCLPPSRHPTTGAYYWINSPADVSVAIAPDWLCQLLINLASAEKQACKAKAEKQRQIEDKRRQRQATGFVGSSSIEDVIEQASRRLLPEEIFNWSGHNWTHQRGSKWSGYCPRHESKSGTAFQVNISTLEWFCHGCNEGGHIVQYRWFTQGGHGTPKGKDFVDVVRALANDAGISMPSSLPISYTSSIHGIDTLAERLISREQWESTFGFTKYFRERVLKTLEASKKYLRAWGFGKEKEAPKEYLTPQIAEYKPGFRLDAWKEAAQEYKFIWDSSGTGTGKSFDAGRVTPKLMDCARIFYVTSDPRNPTTDTLADWALLDGRHLGLATDAHGKLRRVKRGEEYTIQPNCFRVGTISALREAGIEGADSAKLICQTCPYYEACKGGYVFGYLNARMEALKQPRVRSHPASLPMPTGEEAFDYSNTTLVWEEWEAILKNTRRITVIQSDLDQLIVELVAKAPEQFAKLQPLLTALRRLIAGEVKQPNRFGWNHHKLLAQLPALSDDLDVEAVASALEPDLSLIDPTAEYGVSAAELPAGVRKKFTESDDTMAEKVRATLLKQWLIPFLRVLTGKPGYLTLSYGELTITTPDERLVNIAHAAKRNIFLDATGHLDELALLLAILPEEIYNIRQQQPVGAEVRRVQIAGLGRLGQQRGKEQQRRTKAVDDELSQRHPNAGVIRFKRQAQEGDYRWFIESRGVNDAETLDTLILDGIPCENLESLAADFACLYGRPPIEGKQTVKTPIKLTNQLPDGIEPYFELSISADPDFAEFVRRRILANIRQAEGRLRASRRAGEQLTIYILGDYPLDEPVELVRATDITLEAASKSERVELAIKAAVEQLKAAGEKVTQQAIAKIAGYTRGHISRYQNLIILLIEGTISNAIAQASPPDPPPDEAEWLSESYLPLIADDPDEVISLVKVYGVKIFAQIWNRAKADIQIKILSRLFLCLPGELIGGVT